MIVKQCSCIKGSDDEELSPIGTVCVDCQAFFFFFFFFFSFLFCGGGGWVKFLTLNLFHSLG